LKGPDEAVDRILKMHVLVGGHLLAREALAIRRMLSNATSNNCNPPERPFA
jgi:hypothetical protein